MALKVFEGAYKCLKNAGHFAQHLSLRPSLSFKNTLQHCFVDAHSVFCKTPLSCTPVRVHV
eukprot:288819-Heterocapsa_arctica.AAC.1